MRWMYKPMVDFWHGETARLDVTLRFDSDGGRNGGDGAWHYKVSGPISLAGVFRAAPRPANANEAAMEAVYRLCEEKIVAQLQSLADEVKAG